MKRIRRFLFMGLIVISLFVLTACDYVDSIDISELANMDIESVVGESIVLQTQAVSAAEK